MDNKIEKNKLKNQLINGTFYIYKIGLFIGAKVKYILEVDMDTFSVIFEGGTVDVYLEKIYPVKRPGGAISKFKWCYVIRNYFDDVIGYIGEKENQ